MWLLLFLVRPFILFYFVLKLESKQEKGGVQNALKVWSPHYSSVMGSVVTSSPPDDQPSLFKWIQQLTGVESFIILLPSDEICRYGYK